MKIGDEVEVTEETSYKGLRGMVREINAPDKTALVACLFKEQPLLRYYSFKFENLRFLGRGD